jgi:hypothetical protein
MAERIEHITDVDERLAAVEWCDLNGEGRRESA